MIRTARIPNEPNPFPLKNRTGTGSVVLPIYYTRTDVLSGPPPTSYQRFSLAVQRRSLLGVYTIKKTRYFGRI